MVRTKYNANEKIARSMHNLGDETVTYHAVGNDETMLNSAYAEDAAKLEQQSEDYLKSFQAYEQELTKTAGDLSQRPNLQIKPIGNYVLVKPFGTNPFQKIVKSASGLIIDSGGITPQYKSSDTGEWEEEEKYIIQGTVVEVGPEVKWLKKDDIIMWTKPSEVPIPFFKLGFVLVNEQRALCVINDNLNERF